jgi:acetyl esterase/lipase
VRPLPTRPTHADVFYGPSPRQVLDIYLPSKGDGPYPVLLWFGGIWKPAKHPVRLDHFGNAQVAVIAVQTRTMPDAVADKVNPPIAYVANDACRAVQFIRLNAAKYKLDPNRLAAGGGSQGALPALYVACAGERSDPDSKDPIEHFDKGHMRRGLPQPAQYRPEADAGVGSGCRMGCPGAGVRLSGVAKAP